MKTASKLICLLLSIIIMCVSILPAAAAETALTAVGTSIDNADPDYEYEILENGTVEIVEYLGAGGDLVIPSRLGGHPVTQIGAWAFQHSDNRSNITSVIIPDSVEEIGWNAFGECTSLQSVDLGNGVTQLNGYAFADCAALKSLTIGTGFSEFAVSRNDFIGCYQLERIFIDPDNPIFDSRDDGNAIIDSATNELLLGCKSTVIPASVTGIGDYAFSGCINLTAVEIPDSVTTIGHHAFYDCESLKDIRVPDTAVNIGYCAFADTAWYDDQPDGLVYAGKTAYAVKGSCPERIALKDDTAAICDNAFASETGLKSIYIPASVRIIGLNVFSGCSGLERIRVAADNPVFDSRNDCNAVIRTQTDELIYGCRHTVIPDTVTSIGDRAFYGWSYLSHIYIPDSVTVIGKNAFDRCNELKSVTIPRTVTYIGDYAFGFSFTGTKYTPTEDFTIYGDTGTAAYRYANRFHLSFASPYDADQKPGDANADGEITVMDVTIIQRYLAFMNTFMDEPTLMLGDIDQNQILESVDAAYLLRWLAGEEIPYPVG